jgi:putative tricarboxylic transport membrane protein
MRAERIGAAVILLFGAGYLWVALAMEDVTIGDPLGPKVFPVLLGVLMVALALSMLIRPADTAVHPVFRRTAAYAVVLAALLCAYALGIEWIGYAEATFLFLVAAARLLGEKSVLAGLSIPLLVSLGVFELFTRVLDIGLPAGLLAKLLE